MPTRPLIRVTNPGIHQVCTNAHTDYVLTVPAGATGCVLWFEASAADPTLVGGRIGIDQSTTLVTGLTGTDNLLGYHPPMPAEYTFLTAQYRRKTHNSGDTYVHVASRAAGAVCKGMWLFADDDGN